MKKHEAVTLGEAQLRIAQNLRTLPARQISFDAARGCVLAQDITAALDQPPFARSPYDGYALRAADVRAASSASPAALRVVGASFAGRPALCAVGPGQAVRIMTGGAVPSGADCVIAQERTDCGKETVHIYDAVKQGDNICLRGEDFREGECLAPRGLTVTPAVAAVAAAAGLASLFCVPMPRTAVLSTGDELRPLGAVLAPGEIYDANSVYLCMRLQALGIAAAPCGCAADSADNLRARILSALDDSDLLITTGGVSAGQHDLVPDVLEAIGARVVFHGVAIKPGMPSLFALLDGKPVLALSGNPFAAAASFEVLVRPALAALSGNPAFIAQRHAAFLSNAFEKSSHCTRFLRAALDGNRAQLPGAQGNGQLRTMIGCNALVEISAGSGPLPAGAPVTAHLL